MEFFVGKPTFYLYLELSYKVMLLNTGLSRNTHLIIWITLIRPICSCKDQCYITLVPWIHDLDLSLQWEIHWCYWWWHSLWGLRGPAIWGKSNEKYESNRKRVFGHVLHRRLPIVRAFVQDDPSSHSMTSATVDSALFTLFCRKLPSVIFNTSDWRR
jgi:hypothetical protein